MPNQRWALFDGSGQIRSIVTGNKPHATALPVIYPSLDAVDRVSNRVVQKHYSMWDVTANDVTVTYDIIPIDLDTTKRHLKHVLAAHRYKIEVGGIRLPDGTLMPSDRETQSRIAHAHLICMTQPDRISFEWKRDSAWSTLDVSDIMGVATMLADHVQYCYKSEKLVGDIIDATSTVAEAMLIDVTSEFDDVLYNYLNPSI